MKVTLSYFRGISRAKSLMADILSVSPLTERLEELWVVCGFICRKWSYTIGGSLVGIWEYSMLLRMVREI